MPNQTKRIFEFGPFRLDTDERLLLEGNQAVALPPKVFDLLVLLVKDHGHLLEKEWILKTLWPETFVEEANLTVNVSTLRKALGTNGHLIETVPKRGYRFAGEVRESVIAAGASRVEVPSEDGEGHVVTGRELGLPDRPAKRGLRRLMALAATLGLLAGGFFLGERDWFRRVQKLTDIHSMAILPFRPLAGDSAGSDYLGPGIADALVRQMSSIAEIRIRPTASVQKYYGTAVDAVKGRARVGG